MKFREMRRKKQELNRKRCDEILDQCTAGVLAVSGDHGYPYAVPLSYVYKDDKIYCHCAKSGHKIDAIEKDDKVSFCVIDQDEVVSEEYTTYFRSVIAFGRAAILPEGDEYFEAILALSEKYNPDGTREEHIKTIEEAIPRMNMIRIEIEHMTGKEAIELVRRRGQ